MQVRLLGPLDVVDGARTLPLGGTKERTVLAVLALHAGQVVSERALVDAVWPDRPPRTAVKTLQNYVLRLRKALASGTASDHSLRIETRPPGYVLVGGSAVDTAQLTALVASARRAAERADHEAAASLLDQALALWRGQPLEEFADQPFAVPEAARLEELRLSLAEDRVDCDLALGRAQYCVAALESMVAAAPLRERSWGQLMLALYHSGRQADALRAFQRARSVLVEELGIEPGPALRRLEQDIITQAPSLDVGSGAKAAASPTPGTVGNGVTRTFLFTDIEGSTERWEQVPEAMRAALDRHDAIVRRAVAAHAGRVFKSVGDALHADFASPTEGVRAALAAQRHLQSEDWSGVGQLAVRMALYTGEAEPVGDDWLGRPLNRCSRLLAAGSGGQILVSLTTAQLVVDVTDADTFLIDLGEHRLRGLARPEQVYQLVAPGLVRQFAPLTTEGADGSPGLPIPPSLADDHDTFVGRRRECAVLEAAWERARAGKRQVAFVCGEPGIGKTSLARHLAGRVHPEGAMVLYGRCDEGPGLPYQPFVEALQWYVAQCPTPVLRTQLGALGGELGRLVPTLGFRLPDLPEPLRAEPETERYRLFEAVSGLLAGLAQAAPVLVVLDDLQWAAKPTLLLLRHLLRANARTALLVVGTYRDTEVDHAHPLSETVANLRRESGVERVALVGLEPAEGDDLVAAALGTTLDPSSRRVAQALHAQTGGNPFFLGELVRYLDEIGALRVDDGRPSGQLAERLVLGGVTDDLAVPHGARDLIRRRLARLSPSALDALSVAAVVGSSFTLGLMRRIPEAGAEPSQLLDALDEAVATRVVAESPKRPGDYIFVHALMRQVLYDDLGSTRRARLHHRVGNVLEALPGVEQSHLGALAHHFAEAATAGALDKAGRYALAAGRSAIDQLAFEEAVSALTRGVAVLELDYAPDLALRFELLMALGDAHKRADHVAASKAAADRAAADARSLGSAECLARAAAARTSHGTAGLADPVAVAMCEEALQDLGNDHPALRGQVLAGLAFQQALGEGMGVGVDHLAAEAVELARRSGDTETLHAALFVRAVTLTGSPQVVARLAVAEELVELAGRMHDVRVQARGLRVRALAHLELGHLADFNADRERLEQLGVDLHSAVYRGDAAQWRVLQALLAGRFGDVETLVGETLAVAGGDPNFVNASVGQLFFLRRDQGRLDEVVSMVADAAASNPGLIVLRAVRALADLEVGQLEAARTALESLVADDLASVPRDFAWMATASLLAETANLLGHRPAAAALYEALLPHAGHVVVVGWGVVCNGSVDRFLGQLATTLGLWDRAEGHFVAARAAELHLESPPLAVRTAAAYAGMLAARDQPGDPSRANDLLTTALVEARQLGMTGVADAIASVLSTST